MTTRHGPREIPELLPGQHYLAIQTNTDGRPCGWGKGPDLEAAKAVAVEQYKKHCCYDGERVGKLEISVVSSEKVP